MIHMGASVSAADEEVASIPLPCVRSGYFDIKVARFTGGYWGVVRSNTVRLPRESAYEVDFNDKNLNPSGGGASSAGYSLRCLAIE